MVIQETVEIISHRELTSGFWHMVCSSKEIAGQVKAGQFANIRISDTMDPLLRRPISFFNFSKDTIEFIYRVVGYGTELLSKKEVGQTLDVIGPLGRGFFFPDDHLSKNILIVGGGMGAVPLHSLVKELKDQHDSFNVLNGARCNDELLLRDIFTEYEIPYCMITDDGSSGQQGFVTHLLEEKLEELDDAYIYCCGPHPMIKAVVEIANKHDVPCQVSLEEKMACGLGACLGCVVETPDGNFKKVCKDGPVFMSEEIKW